MAIGGGGGRQSDGEQKRYYADRQDATVVLLIGCNYSCESFLLWKHFSSPSKLRTREGVKFAG